MITLCMHGDSPSNVMRCIALQHACTIAVSHWSLCLGSCIQQQVLDLAKCLADVCSRNMYPFDQTAAAPLAEKQHHCLQSRESRPMPLTAGRSRLLVATPIGADCQSLLGSRCLTPPADVRHISTSSGNPTVDSDSTDQCYSVLSRRPI